MRQIQYPILHLLPLSLRNLILLPLQPRRLQQASTPSQQIPIILHFLLIPCLPQTLGPDFRGPLHAFKKARHDFDLRGGAFAYGTYAREMDEHLAYFFAVGVVVVAVPPVARLVDEVLGVAGAVANVVNGALVEEWEFDVGFEGVEGEDFGEGVDGPGVYAEDHHAGIETIVVACGENVFVGEVGGRDEGQPGDFGVHYDGVGVEPAASVQR